MFDDYVFTTIATLLCLYVYIWTMQQVAKARGKYEIKAPATTGNEDFERVFRAQVNTGEYLILFLPLLWLFSILLGKVWAMPEGDVVAGVVGLVWGVGRILFATGYAKSAEGRGRGFLISSIALMIVLYGSPILLAVHWYLNLTG